MNLSSIPWKPNSRIEELNQVSKFSWFLGFFASNTDGKIRVHTYANVHCSLIFASAFFACVPTFKSPIFSAISLTQ